MILSSKNQLTKTPITKKLFFLLILLTIIFLFSGLLLKSKLYDYAYDNILIRTNIKSLGIGGVNRDLNLISILKNFSINILSRFKDSQKFETLIIDIIFKNYSKL